LSHLRVLRPCGW